MRIHVIRAQTLPVALRQTRETYGDDAVILDSVEGPDGAVVRVGVEPEAGAEPAAPQPATARPAQKPQPVADEIAERLAWHGAPPLVVRSLMLAVELEDAEDAETALASALDRVFRFRRPESLEGPLAFVGPPGAGKTAVLAKLAAARSMAGADIAIVNADLETAGAPERIAAFAEALGVEAQAAAGPQAIRQAIAAAGPDAVTLVDTPGRAPADADDIDEAADEIDATGAAVLVFSAAIAPAEAAELADCFAAAGARDLIITQLDIARRIGALLAAADAGDLAIAGVSMGRKVGDGLRALDGRSLARLILAPPPELARARPRHRNPALTPYRGAAA